MALGPTIGGLLVASVGWRWIFWINVPVGVLAVGAGWFLLPRTRQRAAAGGAVDGGGLALLAVATTALLLALSSAAGLPLGAAAIAALAVTAAAAVAGLVWWEQRTAQPLLDPAVLAAPGVAAGLAGALLAYLVLFGPLVLFPQVAAGGGAVLAAGLMLTALPAGFGVAAVAADRVLPHRWSDRARCTTGAMTATLAAGALMAPGPLAVRAVLLTVLGAGLGVYIPANNAAIMAVIPNRVAATVGGMLNMARGLGTAIGVAAVTIALHLTKQAGGGVDVRVTAAMGVLAVAALAAVWAGRSASPAPHLRLPADGDGS